MKTAEKQFVPVDHNPVFSIQEFCERNRLSKTTYHGLPIKPETMEYAGGRITLEAETEWRRKMQEEASSERAQLERQRRVALGQRAGAAAAASPKHVSKRSKRSKKVKREVRR